MNDKYGEIAPYYDMIYGVDVDYEGESLGLHEIFKTRGVKNILDLACGTAAHLIHLGKLGYRGAGIDRSANMLETGRQNAARQEVPIELSQGDIKNIEAEKTFDAVFSLYALGLNAGKEEVKETIKRIPSLLNENGLFIFNIMNAEADWGAPEPFAPYLSFDAVEDNAAGIKATWIYQTMIQEKTQHLKALYIIEDHGETAMYVHNHRITSFTIKETQTLLEECGLKIEKLYSSVNNLQPFSGTEPSMLVVARRAKKKF